MKMVFAFLFMEYAAEMDLCFLRFIMLLCTNKTHGARVISVSYTHGLGQTNGPQC